MPSVNPLEKKPTTQDIKNLPRQQKMAVVFLALLTIGIIVIWTLQLNAQLRKPYGTDKKLTPTPAASSTDEILKSKDTDGDGLSDYDEINIYHTSPYLEDTDGDGINDKQEITQGTDPNCPTGKVCNAGDGLISTSSVSSVISSSTVSGEAAPLTNSGEVTPALLRQILLQNGYDKATLDKVSDDEIMNSYLEANRSQSASTPIPAPASSTISQ